MSCSKHTIKQYDTLNIQCQYSDNDNKPITLDGITIKSQIKTSAGHLIDTFGVTVTDIQNGEFVMTPTINKLPVGTHKIDVMFIKDDKRISSETFNITVEHAVTEYE